MSLPQVRRRKPVPSSRPPSPVPSHSSPSPSSSDTLPPPKNPPPPPPLPPPRLLSPPSPPPRPKWRCLDLCCWSLGNLTFFWTLLFLLYHAIPQAQLQELSKGLGDVLGAAALPPPGVLLARAGLRVRHPVVFVPGIVTGGLELWEGRPCAADLFRKRLWGGTFGDVYKRPMCWMEHIILDNETGLDPPGIRVRPVGGLVAADYFMPGYFVWAVIIEQLAKLGYDERSLHMASYDWRLSFLNTQVRDRSLSRLKAAIEVLVESNYGQKVVVVPHSMGALYFLFFLKWVEAPPPAGGGGGPQWVANNIKAVMNIGGPLLGVPKAFSGIFSAEAKDIAVAREIAPAPLLDTLQTLQHVMRVSRTWDSTMSMIPKGGDAIWGGLDWSPEQGFDCGCPNSPNVTEGEKERGDRRAAKDAPRTRRAHYGRIVAFGRDASLLPAEELPKPVAYGNLQAGEGSEASGKARNLTCGEVWTEYQEMSWRTVQDVAQRGVYTAGDLPDLLRRVAPKMMARSDANWGLGIADDLDDPKYTHPKHWSNPLETRLPEAPDLEIYCLYGVGLLTERAYIYKLSPYNDTCLIPFRIDASVDSNSVKGEQVGCLQDGAFLVDGDETVPALSAGFMCAKGWKGRTRFNPSGSKVYLREYNHAPPTSLLEGRGTQSASHVDIMGNFALIEDILRVATGSSGEDIGGNRVYSHIMEWAANIDLEL